MVCAHSVSQFITCRVKYIYLFSGKRGVAIIFNSDSEESPDDVEPDSDDDVRSTHEKGYDSDKDPAWKPNHITQVGCFSSFVCQRQVLVTNCSGGISVSLTH